MTPFEQILSILPSPEDQQLRRAVRYMDPDTLTFEQVIFLVQHERAHRAMNWNSAADAIIEAAIAKSGLARFDHIVPLP